MNNWEALTQSKINLCEETGIFAAIQLLELLISIQDRNEGSVPPASLKTAISELSNTIREWGQTKFD